MSGLFYKILHRRICDHFNARKKRHRLLEAHQLIATHCDQPRDDGQFISQQMDAKAALRRLAQSNPNRALALSLYHLEGLTTLEIAEQMQLSQGTVCSHLYHGLRQLRKMLEGP